MSKSNTKSELVEAIEEFEALQETKAKLEKQREEAADSVNGARINFQMVIDRNSKISTEADRELQVIRVKLDNTRRQITHLTHGEVDNCCGSPMSPPQCSPFR